MAEISYIDLTINPLNAKDQTVAENLKQKGYNVDKARDHMKEMKEK